MCRGCYEAHGSPVEITPNTRECVEAIGEIYRWHAAGGNAHIVTDDWNLEDDHIESCLDESNWFCRGATPAQNAAERTALILLRGMTIEQRATVLALHEGYIA